MGGENEYEYNVNTRNSFFPLRDRESPDAEYDHRNAPSDHMTVNDPP